MFLNIGCSKQNQNNQEVSSNKTQTGLEYDLVFLDSYIDTYISESKDNAQSKEYLFDKNVISPIFHKYGVNYKTLYMKSIKDADELKKELACFKKEKSSIEKLIQESLNECNKLLPANKKFSVYVLFEDPDIYKKFNVPVRALTPISGTLLLVINTSASDFKTFLPYTVAHEYHHSIDMNKVEKYNLLMHIITEGKAESFAHILFPEVKSKLTSPLSRDEEDKLWNEVKNKFSSEDGNYNIKIVNGGSDNIPLLGGYRLGYAIVQKFIKNNPNISVSEWTNMTAKDIYDKSRYVNRENHILLKH